MCAWKMTAVTMVLCSTVSLGLYADGRLAVGADTGPAGGDATVSLLLEGAEKTGALDVVLTFPPEALAFKSAEVGEVADNAQLQANAADAGKVKLALIDMDGLNGDGEVVVLTFKVLAPAGQTVPIEIAFATANHCEAMVEIPLELQEGQLRIVAQSAGLPLTPRMLKIVPTLTLTSIFEEPSSQKGCTSERRLSSAAELSWNSSRNLSRNQKTAASGRPTKGTGALYHKSKTRTSSREAT